MRIESPLCGLHEKSGARLGTFFECRLPEHFGDVAAEYRAGRHTVALVDINFHIFLSFTGPDRVRYLNAVLTDDIKNLAPGQGRVSLLLNPQGHILAEVETYALQDRLLAISHAMVGERTRSTLEHFIIMDDVTMEDVTPEPSWLQIEGPRAATVVRELCGVRLDDIPLFGHRETAVRELPCGILRRSLFGRPGAALLCARGDIEKLWRAVAATVGATGGTSIGFAAVNALRLEAGVPWFGYDFDDAQIPHEAGLEHSHINYAKGCYTGQEIVERVRSRGQVNRRRAGLEFSGAGVPERGAKLTAAGHDAGTVTSAAFSPAMNRAIGMAYLRREHLATGTRLEWPGGEARVIELGVPENDPAQRNPD